MAHNQELGRRGERAAARWYRVAGYDVLARNWRCPADELDLVAARAGEVVFVEVKARTTARYGTGAEAVGARKQRRIREVAARWLADSPTHYPEIRFDVVDVDGSGHVVVYEGCF